MKVNRPVVLLLTGILALCALARETSAQGWELRPDLNWSYETDLSTSGVFRCALAERVRDGTCSASGNTLLLRHGDASMLLTFTGVSHPLTLVTGSSLQRVTLGTIDFDVEGADDFLFPHTRGNAYPLFSLMIQIGSTTPVVRSTSRLFSAYLPPRTAGSSTARLSAGGPEWFSVADRPDGSQLALVFQSFDEPVLSASGGSVSITSDMALVPEPSTVLLLGSGLLVIAGVATGRRSRAR